MCPLQIVPLDELYTFMFLFFWYIVWFVQDFLWHTLMAAKCGDFSKALVSSVLTPREQGKCEHHLHGRTHETFISLKIFLKFWKQRRRYSKMVSELWLLCHPILLQCSSGSAAGFCSSQIISGIFFKRFPRRSRRFEMPYGPNLYTIWVFRKPKIRLVFPEHFHIFGCHVTAPNISIGDVIHGVHHQNLLKFHSIWGLCQPTSWNMAHMKFLQK